MIELSPLYPEDYPRRILLAVTGMSPQIVTETLYALTVTAARPFIPTEIHLITTTPGAQRAELMLLDSADGRFHQFCTEYGIASGAIRFDAESIHVLAGPDGAPLEDITDEADNTAAADAITEHVRALTNDPQAAVHASIAGGRKTMGFFLGYAMSLYGRAQDRLSHVLVSSPFEQDHQFYYPPSQPKRLIIREQPVHTSSARIMLADIPIVRLRDGLPERLRKGSSSYSAAVTAAQLAWQPPHLCIDLTGGVIEASGLRVDLTPTSLATLALFARRAADEQGPLQAPHKDFGDTEWAERFLTEYRAVKGELQEDDETLVALRNGMDGNYLSQRLSRLHQELKQALGPVAHWYRIDNGGTRPSRYRLPLEAEQVRFGELDGEAIEDRF